MLKTGNRLRRGGGDSISVKFSGVGRTNYQVEKSGYQPSPAYDLVQEAYNGVSYKHKGVLSRRVKGPYQMGGITAPL